LIDLGDWVSFNTTLFDEIFILFIGLIVIHDEFTINEVKNCLIEKKII